MVKSNGQATGECLRYTRAQKDEVKRLGVVARLKKKVVRRNPDSETDAQLRAAARLYEDFTGHEATNYQKINYKPPKTVLTVGRVDGILYTTVRDGEREKYIHHFKKSARPQFAVSHNGKQLLLIGEGKFRFTDRGIVDL